MSKFKKNASCTNNLICAQLMRMHKCLDELDIPFISIYLCWVGQLHKSIENVICNDILACHQRTKSCISMLSTQYDLLPAWPRPTIASSACFVLPKSHHSLGRHTRCRCTRKIFHMLHTMAKSARTALLRSVHDRSGNPDYGDTSIFCNVVS